jgi:hypothetical protein
MNIAPRLRVLSLAVVLVGFASCAALSACGSNGGPTQTPTPRASDGTLIYSNPSKGFSIHVDPHFDRWFTHTDNQGWWIADFLDSRRVTANGINQPAGLVTVAVLDRPRSMTLSSFTKHGLSVVTRAFHGTAAQYPGTKWLDRPSWTQVAGTSAVEETYLFTDPQKGESDVRQYVFLGGDGVFRVTVDACTVSWSQEQPAFYRAVASLRLLQH